MKKNKQLIFGFHSIKSVIRVNASNIINIYLDDSRKDGRMHELLSLLQEHHISYHLFNKERLDELIP